VTAVVLDASAVLAFVLAEPGADKVAAALPAGAAITSVNLAEAATVLIRKGFRVDDIAGRLLPGAWQVTPVDALLGLRAAELSVATRPFGLSLGDRICLAFAEREKCPAMTTDRAWASVNVGVAVDLIR
jgi:ribonuclease VapC